LTRYPAKVDKVDKVPAIQGYQAEDQLLMVAKKWRAPPPKNKKTLAGVSKHYQFKTPVKSVFLAGLSKLATNWDTI
jgi:hypothetical protein